MLRRLVSRVNTLLRHPVARRNPSLTLWRAGAWTLHCLLKIPARPRFRRWNFRLYLSPRWRGGGCTAPYVFREHYEPELILLERYLKPGMVFVDGGANTGVFTFTAARLVGPSGTVLAFEPGRACFADLTKSNAINGFKQVRLRLQALSDRCGTARLYHRLGQENAFTLGADESATFDEVETVALDEVVRAERLPRIDFIKLDVEGAEELVLRGAKEVLRRWRPVVLFEVFADAVLPLNLSVDGACRLLEKYGYQLLQMDDRGELSATEQLPQQWGNVLALPTERLASRSDRIAEATSLTF